MAEGFSIRHRFLLMTLWAQIPIVAAFGLVTDNSTALVGGLCLVVIALALGGMLLPGRIGPAFAVALGLTVAAAAVVGVSGGVGVTHLYFPVVLGAIAYYRLSLPLLAALTGMTLYHFADVLWLSGNEGFVWATLHTGFLALMTVVLMRGWSFDAGDGDAATGDRYQTSFHSAPIGMAVLKPSGEFLEANPAMAHLLGFEPGHFPGRNIRAIVHSDDMPILGEAWEAIGNSESHTYSAWLRCLTAEGGTIWGRVCLALVPHTTRQSAMVILQVEDSTGPRHEQDRLEHLLHGKDAFVATVGTEIRAPLGTVIDLTSGDPKMREIHANVREVASVVDDLVASARAETAPPDVVAASFDVGSACRRVLDGIPRGEKVAVDIRASKVWADPHLTTQIVTGMIGNSIRYGGPKVRLQVFNSGPDTVVQVIDDGPGIPAATKERIFRGDLREGQPVTNPATVGLSLTVGRHLARRMNGDLTYKRSGDGFNIFELRLPSEDVTRSYKPRRRPSLSGTAD